VASKAKLKWRNQWLARPLKLAEAYENYEGGCRRPSWLTTRRGEAAYRRQILGVAATAGYLKAKRLAGWRRSRGEKEEKR